MQSPSISSQLFNGVAMYLPQGLKSIKGRLYLLKWMNSYLISIEPKPAQLLVSPIIDCLTDRASGVRVEASKAMTVLCEHIALSDVERCLKGRPSPDVEAIHSIIDPLFGVDKPSQPLESLEIRESTASSEMDARKRSLSARPGVRVLTKPSPGEGIKNRFSNVKSSIPKPMPRKSYQRVNANPMSYLSRYSGKCNEFI